MLETKLLLAPKDFHSMEKNKYYGSQWEPEICLLLQNIFFCVKQKKETHPDLEQLEGE